MLSVVISVNMLMRYMVNVVSLNVFILICLSRFVYVDHTELGRHKESLAKDNYFCQQNDE